MLAERTKIALLVTMSNWVSDVLRERDDCSSKGKGQCWLLVENYHDFLGDFIFLHTFPTEHRTRDTAHAMLTGLALISVHCGMKIDTELASQP